MFVFYVLACYLQSNHIDSVMVSVVTSNAIDHGFKPM